MDEMWKWCGYNKTATHKEGRKCCYVGGPETTRTSEPQIRSLMLYPALFFPIFSTFTFGLEIFSTGASFRMLSANALGQRCP